MSHQDDGNLRTPLQTLKELLDEFVPPANTFEARHGNASVNGRTMALTALVAFGWTTGKQLTERCKRAIEAVRRILPNSSTEFTTRQGLFKALATCGAQQIEQLREAIIQRLMRQKAWLVQGRPTFAVDGSKFALPRTKANQDYFAASLRKGKSNYKKKADHSKAASPQCNFSLCFHLGSCLPICWKASDSSQGERSMLLEMLSKLPESSRLVMDAFYFGYNFWKQLVDQGHTFVVRAGSNLELKTLLRDLGGKTKARDGLVFYWPESAMNRGDEPIVLRLVEVKVGSKRMFLLTNELSLSDATLADLYTRRWGIEVFFRTVKQSWERSKMESRTPQNVLIELNWTLLGVWASLWLGQTQTGNQFQLSPVQVLRTIAKLVGDVARHSSLSWDIKSALRDCRATDESQRTSSKDSRNYPRKKSKSPTGSPTIKTATKKVQELVENALGQKSLSA